jgi:HEAT repeat protein
LRRTDLPDRVRITLIQSVGAAGLTDAIPVLRQIKAPPAVAEAAWKSLDRLGAGLPEKTLEEEGLGSTDAAIRAAAVRELLQRDGVAAIPQAAAVAIQDPDEATREAAVDALGKLGKPEVLPPLERVFANSSPDLQQAAGRAIRAVGGDAAVDAYWRLAFTGPPASQQYAVVLLMLLNAPTKDAALQQIAATHRDEQVRDLINNGLQGPHD